MDPFPTSVSAATETAAPFGGACYIVSPQDLATIYNISPLWNASSPIDGTGQTIAIVSESDIYPQAFSDFRADVGIPPGTLILTNDGPDPLKLSTSGDEIESDLDCHLG